jgi:protein-disulfide isomerase
VNAVPAALAFALATTVAPASGQTPACDALAGARRELAARVLASEYLYECSDTTIAVGLGARPVMPLAVRLADNVCRRVAAGQDEARIRRGLSRRARSMIGASSAVVGESGAPVAGAGDAPVTVVVYACARCPYCSVLVPRLHDEVAGGSLQGLAKLVFRTFPIRGHEGSTEAGLALVAAHSGGRFWEYLLHAYSRFDAFSPAEQRQWAAAVGLDPATFAAGIDDPATREALVAIKKEGLANGVAETPTVFLNGRRWVGDLELAELMDAVEEEAARVRGTLCALP